MSNGPSIAAGKVMETLLQAGFQAFLVGGCVRDQIMGVEPKDYDVTTDATPDQVMALFPHTVAVGASFGVVRIQIDETEIEVATFRADGEYTDGRRPDTVSFSKTLEEDVVRRDFTINGLAMDINGKVTDLVGGMVDIHNKIVRAIGNPYKRIEEDSLRMLRAVRFAARFDSKIDPATQLTILRSAHMIHRVSQERITDEILKMLSGPRPLVALRLLAETTLLTEIFPEFKNNDEIFCRDENLDLSQVLRLGRVTPKMSLLSNASPMVGLVVLLSEFKDEEFFAVLDRMKLSSEEKKIATTAFTFRHELQHFPNVDNATVVRFKRLPGYKEALTVFNVECMRGKNRTNADCLVLPRVEALDAYPPPLVTGRDLIAAGHTPGPVFTPVLRELETLQLNGVIDSKEQALHIAKVMIAAEAGTLQVRQG
jgi:tRNA nucleotidyltransferase/poly(A) polymerase